MLDFLNEADRQKQELASIGVTEADIAPEPAAPLSLLEPPQHWTEKAREEDGDMKFFGKMLLGGFTGMTPLLFPEMIGSKERYKSDLATYQAQQKAQLMGELVNNIDFDNLTAGDVAILEQAGMGEQAADMFTAQTAGIGADEAIAESFGYTPYQWSQLSPETKRDLRDRHAYGQTGPGTFDYRLRAEGKAPEQVQDSKQSELYGSGLGQQYSDDRKLITGVRGQVMKADQTLSSIDNVMSLLQDPENDDLTGIERQIRDMFWANRREDGTLDAVTAAGIVDLISQATFGALSQSELDLLKGGLMDATKSTEYNIGTLTQARKRVEDDRDRYISAGQGAAGRYSQWDGQEDYDSLMSDDWNYLNIGEGSKIKPIVVMVDGEEKTVTFSDYYNARMEKAGPYEDLSREQILVDYRKAREAEKELWEKQQEVKRQLQEEARQALELEFQE